MNKNLINFARPKSILGLDIGEKYTGVAMVHNLSNKGGMEGANIMLEQINHKSKADFLDCARLEQLISMGVWDAVIVEQFKLYPSRTDKSGNVMAQTHFKTWSYLQEIRHLGVAIYACNKLSIPVIMQDASQVKNMKRPIYTMGGHKRGSHVVDAVNHVKKFYLSTKYMNKPPRF